MEEEQLAYINDVVAILNVIDCSFFYSQDLSRISLTHVKFAPDDKSEIIVKATRVDWSSCYRRNKMPELLLGNDIGRFSMTVIGSV